MEENKEVKKQIGAHDNFNPEKRRNRITLYERKFLAVLALTCNKSEAFRAVYKVAHQENKQLEAAYVHSEATKVLKRIKRKSPELYAAATFENITPDFVTKAILDLYGRAKEKEDMNIETRVVDMMAKTQNMFKETSVIETKVQDVIKNVYKETDDDMPTEDKRVDLQQFNERYVKNREVPKV